MNLVRTAGWPTSPPARPDEDVARSWALWTDAAREVGERELAVTLDEIDRSAPVLPEDVDPRAYAEYRAVQRARDLMVVGRHRDARDLLVSVGVAPPESDDVRAAQLVLAAAHAADGDDDAWSWLLTTSSRVGAQTYVAPLVGAAADARGDLRAADAAWIATPRDPSVTRATRLATAYVAARPREDLGGLSEVIGSWVGVAVGLDEGRPTTSLAIADRLAARGDVAGARLFLRLVTMFTSDSRELRVRLRELRPARRPWDVVALGLGLVAIGAVAVAVAAGLLHVTVLVCLPLYGAVAVWGRRKRLPGLSRAESQLWRGMRDWVHDPETGTASEGTPHAALYTVAGIVGFVAGIVLAVSAAGRFAEAVAGDAGTAWLSSSAGFAAQIAITALVAAIAVLATRAAVRRYERARSARKLRSLTAARETEGQACRCWSDTWLRGWLADSYARQHLQATTLVSPLSRSSIRRCPGTGVLWLTGDLAVGDRAVALRGRAPERDAPPPAAPAPAAPTGMYL